MGRALVHLAVGAQLIHMVVVQLVLISYMIFSICLNIKLHNKLIIQYKRQLTGKKEKKKTKKIVLLFGGNHKFITLL